MIPRFPFSTPPCTDIVEGAGKFSKGFWLSKSFGSLFILTMLVVSFVVLEFRTEVATPWRASGLFRSTPPEPVQLAAQTSSEPEQLVAQTPPEPEQLATQTPCQKVNDRYTQMGINSIPRGIIQETTDLHFRAMAADPITEAPLAAFSQSLLTMPAGIKQKETVNKIVEKFPQENFTVMLFHYDGIVDEWNVFPWSRRAIHVVASNQTKWWFAKRFLHPDIVSSYKYIFVWDEDIGVENFHAGRYLEIVEKEGLEISQPALDPQLSEVHHQITARMPRGLVHRRMYKSRGSGLCYQNSTDPPCTGWVEMMVPVFSQAAWRCAWYMIQNDLVHAWGLDMKLGYCAQGDRSQKVGVVDDQYVVHYGIPSLGGLFNKTWDERTKNVSADLPTASKPRPDANFKQRGAVRRRSYVELQMFRKRWDRATKKDECWTDPFKKE